MAKVIIGVDPHKLSATIEVVDRNEKLLGSGRFSTDQVGYSAMRTYAKTWPERVWAIEGSNGAGRPLAQRLLEAGELVVDVPARLSAAGKTSLEALRCLKRRISEPCTDSSSPTPNERKSNRGLSWSARVREGAAGRLKNPARSTCPPTSTLRISHFPDPQTRRYNRPGPHGRPPAQGRPRPPVDNKGEPK